MEEKNVFFRRLLKYMLGAPTETCKKVLGENTDKPEKAPAASDDPAAQSDKPKGPRSSLFFTSATITLRFPQSQDRFLIKLSYKHCLFDPSFWGKLSCCLMSV
jgi:hypothetical protein